MKYRGERELKLRGKKTLSNHFFQSNVDLTQTIFESKIPVGIHWEIYQSPM